MADILIDNQAAPSSSPSSSKSILFVDSTSKSFVQMDDAGAKHGSLSRIYSTASQGAGFATDTYITSSGILIPSFGMAMGQYYHWQIHFSKTAAGTVAPVVILRTGTLQTTSDTTRSTMTGQAGTAAVSGGIMLVGCLVRNVGAAGVLACSFGFAAGVLGPGGGIDNVAGSFDNSAMAGQYVSLSLNAGTSAAWTITAVYGELIA